MNLDQLQQRIEEIIGQSKRPLSELKKATETLSRTYIHGFGSSSIFAGEAGRLAYLAARMPATFSAVCSVLQKLPATPVSWLDLGSGPAAASWAIASVFPQASDFTLIEKNVHAIQLGKELSLHHPHLQNANWICASLPTPLPKADAAILSYSLGEIAFPEQMIEQWWEAAIDFLILIEPGTPAGFSRIRNTRKQILSLGGFLIAPCPHALPCPLQSNDWCHFSTRVARTRLHKYLKGGERGFEDEKYCYLIASKTPLPIPSFSRILRSPQKQKGRVRLSLCTEKGQVEEITIGRSNREAYRKARDASWGDDILVR